MPGLNVSPMGPSGLVSQALNTLLQLQQEQQQDGFKAQATQVHEMEVTVKEQATQIGKQADQNALSQELGGIGQMSAAAFDGAAQVRGRSNASNQFDPAIKNQQSIIDNTTARQSYVNNIPAKPMVGRGEASLANSADAPTSEGIIEKYSSAKYNAKTSFSVKNGANEEEKTEIQTLPDAKKTELVKELRSTRKQAQTAKTSLEGRLSDKISNWSRNGELIRTALTGAFQVGAGTATMEAGEHQELQTLLGTALEMIKSSRDATAGMINTAQQAQSAEIQALGGKGMEEKQA